MITAEEFIYTELQRAGVKKKNSDVNGVRVSDEGGLSGKVPLYKYYQ